MKLGSIRSAKAEIAQPLNAYLFQAEFLWIRCDNGSRRTLLNGLDLCSFWLWYFRTATADRRYFARLQYTLKEIDAGFFINPGDVVPSRYALFEPKTCRQQQLIYLLGRDISIELAIPKIPHMIAISK